MIIYFGFYHLYVYILLQYWTFYIGTSNLSNSYIVLGILWSWFMPIAPRSLTHWGRVTHICLGNLTNIDSDNGLLPGRRQAIIWTNAGLLLIGPLGTNFSEILGEIRSFSFKKTHLKMSSAKWRLYRLGLNELMMRYRAEYNMTFVAETVWRQYEGKPLMFCIICGRIDMPWNEIVHNFWPRKA